jgi:hypothetical protein
VSLSLAHFSDLQHSVFFIFAIMHFSASNRDVTSKTKTHIYDAIVKRTITYAAETWFLKAKSWQN